MHIYICQETKLTKKNVFKMQVSMFAKS